MTTEERIAEKVLDAGNCEGALVEAQGKLAERLYREGGVNNDFVVLDRDRVIPLYLEQAVSVTFASVPDVIEGEPVVDFKKLRRAAEEKAKAMMPTLFGEGR